MIPAKEEVIPNDLVKTFHERLDWLQFERNFDDCKFLIVDQMVHGFGGQLSRRMLGLQLGYMFDRTVIFVRPNDPPYVTCLEPTGKWTYDDVKDVPVAIFNFKNSQPDKVVFFDFDSFWREEGLDSPIYRWVPDEFLQAGYNRPFFDGQLLTRLKFTAEFCQYVASVKKRIGYQAPIIGLHIRRGDKYTEAPYVPLKFYANALKSVCRDSGITRVFVTSDSEEAIRQIRKQVDLELVWDDEEPRYNNANHAFLQEHAHLAKQETLTAVKIFELLTSADQIIGPDNAHLTNLAVALNSARTGNLNNFHLIPGNLTYRKASLWHWPLLTAELSRQYVMKKKPHHRMRRAASRLSPSFVKKMYKRLRTSG